MNTNDCASRLRRPSISIADQAFSEAELNSLRELTSSLAASVLRASENTSNSNRQCGLGLLASQKLADMSDETRQQALRRAKSLARQSASRDSDGIVSSRLHTAIRRMARERMTATRPAMQGAIRDVVSQVRAKASALSKTSVKIRPAGEVFIAPRRSHCTDTPQKVTCDWVTSEPNAARAYWELRGPGTLSAPGRFLARGYAENMRDDGGVGGSFDLDMTRFAPPQTPDPTAAYSVRVLPLRAAETGPVFGRHQSHAFTDISANAPPPPTGVGPWSPPGFILIGLECQSPGTRFEFDADDYYRKMRFNVDWFKVDSDQPGPGDEEYHLSGFVIKQSSMGTTALGSFGSYLPVEEGDQSRHHLGWRSYVSDLDGPRSLRWPLFLVIVLSVLEEDSGDDLQDWMETMAELGREALEGDLRDEIQDYLEEVREDIAEATDDLHESLREEAVAYITALIGAAALNAALAVVVAAVGFIQIWARAGAMDDHYGVEALTVSLLTSDTELIASGDGWKVKSSRPLSAGGQPGGTEQNGRFLSDTIELQLIARASPDAAGLDGIVRIGMSLEFYDKATFYNVS